MELIIFCVGNVNSKKDDQKRKDVFVCRDKVMIMWVKVGVSGEVFDFGDESVIEKKIVKRRGRKRRVSFDFFQYLVEKIVKEIDFRKEELEF